MLPCIDLPRALNNLAIVELAFERALALLAKVRLAEKRDAYPGELSGGQQQRVAIARSLAMRPEVMLFDEVTAALDPETVKEVLNTIRELASEGMTCILVTHEMRFAREIADDVHFTDGGTIVESGPPPSSSIIRAGPTRRSVTDPVKRYSIFAVGNALAGRDDWPLAGSPEPKKHYDAGSSARRVGPPPLITW
jgi:ABC-type histidine transport system ATPase subunit